MKIKRRQSGFRYHASAAIQTIRDDCRRNEHPDIYQTSYKPLLLQTSQNFRRKKLQSQSLEHHQKQKSLMNNLNFSLYSDCSYQSAFTPKPKSSKSLRYAFNSHDKARKASRATHLPFDSSLGMSSITSDFNQDPLTTFLMRLYLAKTKDLQIVPNHKQEKIFVARLRDQIKDKQFVAPECDFGVISTQLIIKYLQKHSVQKIILDKNPLGDESCKNLAEVIPLLKIKQLSLVSINITSKSGIPLINSLVGAQFLQQLNLSSPEGLNRNRINPEGFANIKQVLTHSLCCLHTLNLSNTGMGQIGFVSFLMGFQQVSHLNFKILNLSYNQISINQNQQSFVTNCFANVSVQRLQLQGNNFSDLGGKILAYIIGGKYGRSTISANLTYLNVSDNKIKSYGFQSLCNLLPTNKKLVQFYADKNNLAEKDVFYCVRNFLINTWSTKVLSLRHTLPASADKVLHHVKSLSEGLFNNKSLRQLDISYTSLEQSGFYEIFDSLQANKTLKVLKLQGCGIKDSFLIKAEHVLKQNKYLMSLNLSNNFITDKGAKVLLKILAQAHDLMEMNLKKNCISLHILCDIQYQIKENRNMNRPEDPQFLYIKHVTHLQEEQKRNIQTTIHQLSSKKNYLSAKDLAIDIVKDQQELIKRQQQIKAERLRINNIQSQIHNETLEKLKKRKKQINNQQNTSFSVDNSSFLVTN